jgi:hypothetical protein
VFRTFTEFKWTLKIDLAFFNVCDSPADESEILLGVADGVGRAGVVQDARDRKQALKNQQIYGSGSGQSAINKPPGSGLFYQRLDKNVKKNSILILKSKKINDLLSI